MDIALVKAPSRVQVSTFGDLLQRVPGASAIDHRCAQIGAKCKSNWRNFTHSICKGKIEGKIGELLRHALRPQMVQMMFT